MALFSDEDNDQWVDDAPAQELAVDSDDAAVDVPVAETEPEIQPQPQSFWMWLRGLLSGPVDQRLRDLTRAIAQHPEAASNYVLRGEIWLDMGEYEMAAADFEWARGLAALQFDEANWGVLSQTLRDQAEQGLQRALRKLARRPHPPAATEDETS
jgi:tetratricopeptide (TPR) repeat protein